MARPYHIKVKGAGQDGQTLVEFALILGLIIALLFGVMEFARAWQYTNALTNGVRDGARFAARTDGSANYKAEVQSYTFSVITSEIPNDPSLTVEVYKNNTAITGTPSFATTDTVKVEASYDFDILTGSIIPFFSGTRTLTKSATMSHE